MNLSTRLHDLKPLWTANKCILLFGSILVGEWFLWALCVVCPQRQSMEPRVTTLTLHKLVSLPNLDFALAASPENQIRESSMPAHIKGDKAAQELKPIKRELALASIPVPPHLPRPNTQPPQPAIHGAGTSAHQEGRQGGGGAGRRGCRPLLQVFTHNQCQYTYAG